MTNTDTKKEETKSEPEIPSSVSAAAPVVVASAAPVAGVVRPPFRRNQGRPTFGQNKGGFGGRPGFGGGKFGRGVPGSRPDLDTKVLSIRRVARGIAGGKRFTFSVCLVLGDKKGSVGVGMAKAGGTSEAIEKATRDAKKNMVKLNLTKSMSIPHETRAKYCSGIVDLRPAPGRGLIAGSAPRVVLALAGITDINAKIISGSKNKINNARATFKALKSLSE